MPDLETLPWFGNPRFRVWGRDQRRNPSHCPSSSARRVKKNKRAPAHLKKVLPLYFRCSPYPLDVVPLLWVEFPALRLTWLIVRANDVSGSAVSIKSKERIVVGFTVARDR